MGMKIVAQVVIADARPHRKGATRKGGFQPAIAVGVATVGDVAGGEQQVGSVRPLDQQVEDVVEALAVIFGRIVRIEADMDVGDLRDQHLRPLRSDEHTSELQSLMRISYAVFCLKKNK